MANAPWQARVVYACADGTLVTYRRETAVIIETLNGELASKEIRSVGPRNGVQLRHGVPRPIVAETVLNRHMIQIVSKRSGPTYALPRSVKTVGSDSFRDVDQISVRFNEGLEMLGYQCFWRAKIQKVAFPASVSYVNPMAFCDCTRLEHVDLRAASSLKNLEHRMLFGCSKLRCVLLGEGLQTIPCECF